MLGQHKGHRQIGRQAVQKNLHCRRPPQAGAQYPDPLGTVAGMNGVEFPGCRDLGLRHPLGDDFQPLFHRRLADEVHQLGDQAPLPLGVAGIGTRRGLAITEQDGGGGLFQQVIEKVLPAILAGQVHHPQVQGTVIQPAFLQGLRVGVDHHLVALCPDRGGQQVALQCAVGNHADAAWRGHSSPVSCNSPSNSRMVESSSFSWNGLPM